MAKPKRPVSVAASTSNETSTEQKELLKINLYDAAALKNALDETARQVR